MGPFSYYSENTGTLFIDRKVTWPLIKQANIKQIDHFKVPFPSEPDNMQLIPDHQKCISLT